MTEFKVPDPLLTVDVLATEEGAMDDGVEQLVVAMIYANRSPLKFGNAAPLTTTILPDCAGIEEGEMDVKEAV